MGMSETILAAMIGAAATIMTAIFQLVMAFRSRSKTESRPKRSAMRSLLSIFAIILASAVAGFGYAELRAERAREDTRALRDELKQQMSMISSYAAQLEQLRSLPRDVEGMITLAAARSTIGTGNAEAIAHLESCRSAPPAFGNDPVACAERSAQRLALCAVVPQAARVQEVQLFARPADATGSWEQQRVTFGQDVGGLRFTDKAFEQDRDAEAKAVCANVSHWSSDQAHAVRIAVVYATDLNPTAVALPPH